MVVGTNQHSEWPDLGFLKLRLIDNVQTSLHLTRSIGFFLAKLCQRFLKFSHCTRQLVSFSATQTMPLFQESLYLEDPIRITYDPSWYINASKDIYAQIHESVELWSTLLVSTCRYPRISSCRCMKLFISICRYDYPSESVNVLVWGN